LVDGGENLLLHQFFYDQVGFNAKFLGKFFYGDAFGNGDLAINGRRLDNGWPFRDALAKDSFL
jgi:hypothetical protein